MQQIFTILTGVLVFLAMISLFWTIVGVPVGIILFIVNHFKKTIKNKKKVFWMCFGGLIALIAVFILFFIVSLIQGFFGISPSHMQLPQIQQ
jgi:hypothetical protein